MHTPTYNPHKPILLFTTTSTHITIPKQRIGNYGVCGWKDRCRDGNLRTYCRVSPILFGCFFVEASHRCFCIFVKCFFVYIGLTAKDFVLFNQITECTNYLGIMLGHTQVISSPSLQGSLLPALVIKRTTR